MYRGDIMFFKKIIDVETLIDRVGDVRPLTIIWENGARYKIDKILRHEPLYHSHVGDIGEMFVVEIGKETRTMYLEKIEGGRYRWFIETLKP